jgi:hypothetical protein
MLKCEYIEREIIVQYSQLNNETICVEIERIAIDV